MGGFETRLAGHPAWRADRISPPLNPGYSWRLPQQLDATNGQFKVGGLLPRRGHDVLNGVAKYLLTRTACVPARFLLGTRSLLKQHIGAGLRFLRGPQT